MTNAIKLANFIDSGLDSSISEILVTKEHAGRYTLFNKYSIVLNKRGFYTVFSSKTMSLNEFSSLKIATTWCVLDHLGRYSEGRRLEHLDLKLCSIAIDIAVHKKKIKSSNDVASKLIYTIKLQEDNFCRRQTLQEIETYINNSRALQEQKFRAKAPKINYV